MVCTRSCKQFKESPGTESSINLSMVDSTEVRVGEKEDTMFVNNICRRKTTNKDLAPVKTLYVRKRTTKIIAFWLSCCVVIRYLNYL